MLIPKPHRLTTQDGYFLLSAETPIYCSGGHDSLADIAAYLLNNLPFDAISRPKMIDETEPRRAAAIYLSLGEEGLGAEGYRLSVSAERIEIAAENPAGLFYGVQSLRQLQPVGPDQPQSGSSCEFKIPCLEVVDQPRFSWRGMLLDCSRHFMTVDFIKRYLDLLAFHKMNVFHWHLTDDQGWRLHIKRYPKLTEIGAWREYEDGSRYGGFYTAEDVREIVDYARSRFITVVPEIELPGHALAALSAYPELSCTGGPFEVEVDWNIYKDVYCAGNDHTFEFLKNVLSEVVELFPGPYIHIGGDECLKDRWKQCPKCQARMRAEGLADEHQLQSYFICRIQKHLQTLNKSIIGWDEILEGGLAPGAVVQSWQGMAGAIAAATAGHDAIVSPTTHAYFDYDLKTIDVKKVYEFEPVPDELTVEQAKHILGGECNMWSERAPQPYIDRQLFPRLVAMAEVLWSPVEGRNFQDFRKRLKQHYFQLDALGVGYGKETQCVAVTGTFVENETGCKLEVDNLGPDNSDLRFSLDGSQPTLDAEHWDQPIRATVSTRLRTALFHQNKQLTSPNDTRVLLSEGALLRDSLAGLSPQIEDEDISHSVGRNGGPRSLWMAVSGENMTAVLDLCEPRDIHRIDSHFLQFADAGIFLPISVEYAISDNGADFEILWATGHNRNVLNKERLIRAFTYRPETLHGRFIRLRAVNIGKCPANHPREGEAAWMGLQRISVS